MGRTVGSPDTRLARHIGMAKENAPHPVHRWLWRLGQLGLNPILHVVGTDFSPGVELELCEGLVETGARLLNIAPGGARKTGRIIVELEEIAGECHVDVIHLGITFRTPSSRNGRVAGAAAAFRKLADVLEGTNAGSHLYGTAYEYAVDNIEVVAAKVCDFYVRPYSVHTIKGNGGGLSGEAARSVAAIVIARRNAPAGGDS